MSPDSNIVIRQARPTDAAQLKVLRTALWPESATDNDRVLQDILGGTLQSVFPLVIFVAEENNNTLVGFLEAGIRSTADGCDISRPVGYIEGWYVVESHRGRGVGRQLLRAAEDWARARGCREMASDTAIDNQLSQRVHKSSGFTVAARAILYRKSL